MGRVELHNAWQWDCEACGRENFARAVTAEMSADDIAEMRAEYGGDREDWLTGEWTAQPEYVVCGHCGAEYRTADPRQPGGNVDQVP